MRWGRAMVALLLLVGCDDGGVSLFVDLQTDFVSGREIAEVLTEVEDASGAIIREERYIIRGGERFLEGARVAELSGLTAGTYTVRARVLSPDGRDIGRGRVVAMVNDSVVRVRVLRACPDGEDCALCETVDDCSAAPMCVSRTCNEGACLLVPDPSGCEAGFECDLMRGCSQLPTDGGVSCLPTATSDDCGLADEDCDGLVDEDCGCDGAAWELSPVDAEDGAEAGRGIDLAVTPQGSLHAAYYARNELRYATHPTGTPWVSTDVEGRVEPRDYPMAAAIDAAGTLHVLYRGDGEGLAYTQRLRDGSWGDQTLGEGDARFPSLALDAGGAAHASYRDQNRRVVYAHRPAFGGWGEPVLIAPEASEEGDASAVAVDPTGAPFVVYYAREAREMRLASRDGAGVWSSQTVEAADNLGDRVALAIAADGTVHAAYLADGPRAVHYARRSPGASTFDITRIAEGREPRDALDLALTSDGEAHVVYLDRNETGFYLASTENALVPRRIARAGNNDPAASITVDVYGNLQIAYRDDARRDLMRAVVEPDGTIWREPVRTYDDQGEHAAIACDGEGGCQIVARSQRGTRFGHSHARADAYWHIERVADASGDDQDPSLRVLADGSVLLAFRAADESLAFATRSSPGGWTIESPQTVPERADDPELFAAADGSIIAIAHRAGGELRWAQAGIDGWAVSTIDPEGGRRPTGVVMDTGRIHLAYQGPELRYRVREPGAAAFDAFEVVVLDRSQFPDLTLASGQPVIGYYDDRRDDALLATREAVWSSEPIQSANSVGEHMSVADDEGTLYAAYYDGTVVRDSTGAITRRNEDLIVSHRAPGDPGFTRTVVDSEGNSGRYASLALDGRGRLFVAYHYENQRQLRLARRCR